MIPEDCLFTKEHEWVYVEKGTVVIGISEYAANELGDIVYIELPEVGTHVKQMDPMGTIEAVKTVAELFSPVSGEVIEVNEDIVHGPEIVNKSPYEDGWFLKIKMDDTGELDSLFNYDEYNEMVSEQQAEESVEDEMVGEEE
jgi:glycine cleavage system H protein